MGASQPGESAFPAGELPFISVILPVRNEANSLPDVLLQLLDQQYPADRYEILVADGGSTDGTQALVLACAATARTSLRLIRNPGVRSGPGRNAGILASRGQLIVFVDGHCDVPTPLLLAHTAAIFQATGADCLCRPQPLLAAPTTPTGRMIAAVRASWLGHGRDSLIYDLEQTGFVDPASSGACYRREVFARVGLYDESFDACEDVELNIRVRQAGYRAYTDPRLALYYQPRGSVGSLWRQMVRYGKGRGRLMRKHPESRSLPQLAPVGLLASLLLLPVAVPALPWYGSLLLAVFPACFAAAVMVCSAQLARERGPRAFWQAPVLFATIYGGLGVGLVAGLAEGLGSSGAARWDEEQARS